MTERKIAVQIGNADEVHLCGNCDCLESRGRGSYLCPIFNEFLSVECKFSVYRCQECLDAEIKNKSRKQDLEVGPYTGRTILDIELDQE